MKKKSNEKEDEIKGRTKRSSMTRARNVKPKKDGTLRGFNLSALCENGIFEDVVKQYILDCAAKNEEKSEKERDKKSVFPNLAGFCRFCGVTRTALLKMKEKFPEDYEMLCTVLLDEAWNSDASPSLISSYLKNEFGYGESKAQEGGGPSIIMPVFEHNILEDGE